MRQGRLERGETEPFEQKQPRRVAGQACAPTHHSPSGRFAASMRRHLPQPSHPTQVVFISRSGVGCAQRRAEWWTERESRAARKSSFQEWAGAQRGAVMVGWKANCSVVGSVEAVESESQVLGSAASAAKPQAAAPTAPPRRAPTAQAQRQHFHTPTTSLIPCLPCKHQSPQKRETCPPLRGGRWGC